ncbi:hypothetical protein NPIL_167791 [Nephila pilipes]|uniref:Methyltransferase type 11 domain-containing protein n=1 Tax=Nephila pilipes TaxID=299642 RepID=A0A8X6QR46_NEPPI|nr:hypothetical protein NPIL_167791 [Nephila pilipes]
MSFDETVFFRFIGYSKFINMYFDAELYNDKVKPWETVTYFINKTLPRLGWNSDEPEVVMDVGSGPGNISKNYILPAFPNLKKLIAMDATPSMIEVAKLRHPHSNIEYVVANLEDRATIKEWMGQITKLISIHCFNWLKDQKSGFQASYDLLKPGGEAAFLFGLQPPYYNGIIETGNHPKYNSYLKCNDNLVPDIELELTYLSNSFYLMAPIIAKIPYKCG